MNIRKVMKKNEREVMKVCRRKGCVGANIFMIMPWKNAISRLVEKEKLRYSKYEMAYVEVK